MIITLEQLKQLNACPSQLDLFEKKFGTSVEPTLELCLAHAQNFEWNWAARKLLSEEKLRIYLKTMNQVYDETIDRAENAYDEIMAQVDKVYDESQAKKVYDEIVAQARKVYEETKARTFAELICQARTFAELICQD